MTAIAEPIVNKAVPGTIEAFRAEMIGQYRDVPFDEYLKSPLMSQSILKKGVEPSGSMLHLKHALDNRGKTKPTDAMIQGSALHCAFLEPALMPTKVALWTGDRRAGKEWEAFKEENSGKAILTKGFHENLVGMLAALRRNKDIRKWVSRIEEVEISAVGMLHGCKLRCRADALTDDPLWDLKKIASTDDRTIDAAINTYGLHVQGYIYREIFQRERFCLGFVEESAPHDVRVVELSPAWLRIGKAEATAVLQRYQWCLAHNDWPGRGKGEGIELREPPEWKINNSGVANEVTIDGEKAFEE